MQALHGCKGWWTHARKPVCLIAAVSKNGIIGKDGKLPWDAPVDRKRFMRLTIGCPVIYGRHIYEKELERALLHRTNIVLSSNPAYQLEDALTATSLEAAISKAQVCVRNALTSTSISTSIRLVDTSGAESDVKPGALVASDLPART